eukprot:gene9471-19666_t
MTDKEIISKETSKNEDIAKDIDSDDEVTIGELIKKKNLNAENKSSERLSVAESKPANDDVESDDSDDNIPIGEIMKKRSLENKEKKLLQAPPAKKMKVETKSETKSTKNNEDEKSKKNNKQPDKPKSKDTTSQSQKKKAVTDNTPSSSLSIEFYEDTKKGFLVHSILRRWWYAIKWPKPDEVFNPPNGYEPLDGFKGVFVCTNTANLGHILDLRDHSKCPCLRNFAKKSTEELKNLCVQAIKAQLAQLIEAEGSNPKLERRLKDELKQVESINAAKADKDAKKYVF